jgi:hypothetical protein
VVGWGSFGIGSCAYVMSMWCRVGWCWIISGFEVFGEGSVAGRGGWFIWGDGWGFCAGMWVM